MKINVISAGALKQKFFNQKSRTSFPQSRMLSHDGLFPAASVEDSSHTLTPVASRWSPVTFAEIAVPTISQPAM